MKSIKKIILSVFLINIAIYGICQNTLVPFDLEHFQLKDSINSNLNYPATIEKMKFLGQNDEQRLHIIAGWIFNNFDYDSKKQNPYGFSENFDSIFVKRKGSCIDYAILFKRLCNDLNITCEIIEGYVPYHFGEETAIFETNYVWNVVNLNNEWYHCDLVHFSGNLITDSTGNSAFHKSKDITEFLTRTTYFIVRHIPADPMWQLSEHPISLDSIIIHGFYAKPDSNGNALDYKEKIKKYLTLNENEKKLFLADNALVYNKNNTNIVIINYYNVAIHLINNWEGNKNNIKEAIRLLNKSKELFAIRQNGIENIEAEINTALERAYKYLTK